MGTESSTPNRLAHETSPYLLQHAHNPVDWYPWGPEALERAASEDKPILLSIGYSACHWCHVMERESFEDPAVAEIMNARFINIKVDREERPDLDEIYMQATQVFTGGQGGWPMTVFLTPQGEPFMGGTYFPPYPRYGMPSFRQLMDHAENIWRTQRDRLDKITAEVSEHLAQLSQLPPPSEVLRSDWLERQSLAAEREYDDEHGGFGYAPKFPAHGTLAALLAYQARSGSRRNEQMLQGTLDNMAKGGMYDLAGGGFARYSVDEEWRIPHFEKMLYDNAQLVPIYLDGWLATGRHHYRRVARETLDYVLREMTHPEGGFCASQDADSDGEEGLFFCWTQAELKTVLGVLDGARAALLLSVTETGTFERGTSVLRLAQPIERYIERDRQLLERALPALYAARSQRTAPGRDDKVITAWNGTMASAFARAGLILGEDRYVEAARRAVEFLLDTLVVDGRLQRTWKDGRAHIPALADDHAALIGAMIDLFEATGETDWLSRAQEWSDTLISLFWDEEDGGFFYTGHDAESLVTRSKHTLGGSEPSANGLAALAFARLEVLAGRTDLGERADRILRSYQPMLEKAPRAVGLESVAAAWRTGKTRQLVIIGSRDDSETQALLDVYRCRHLPFCALAVVEPQSLEATLEILPWIEGKGMQSGAPTAWLCEGFSCRLPTTSPQELAEQLDGISREDAHEAGATRLPAAPLPSAPESWLQSAQPLTIDALKGRIVVLDFWTYCCINCMHVLPELAAVEAHFEGQPVTIIGVHSAKFPTEAERTQLEKAIRRHDIRHPVVHDPTHETWKAWGVKSWPTVTILDAEGRIAWTRPGEPDRHTLIATVERLLAEGRDTGMLGDYALAVEKSPPHTETLRFPGKVRAWPSTAGQEMGRDPLGPDARLYVTDTGNHRILELSLSKGEDGWPRARHLRTFGCGEAGHQDGPIQLARFREPQGCDREGDQLYVADTGNHMLRSIDLRTGTVRTLAGTGRLGRGGAMNPDPRKVALRSPWDVVMAGSDNGSAKPGEGLLFIAMAGTHQIWAYNPTTRQLAPFIGDGREAHIDGKPQEAALAQPSGIVLYGRYMFFADSETSSVRVLDLESYKVGTVVGQGLFDFGDIDGAAGEVRLQHPMALTAAEGNIFVADSFNHKIKVIELPGARCRTLTGGHPEILDEPGGLTRVGDFLVVADTGNHRLRVVEISSGEIRDLDWH